MQAPAARRIQTPLGGRVDHLGLLPKQQISTLNTVAEA